MDWGAPDTSRPRWPLKTGCCHFVGQRGEWDLYYCRSGGWVTAKNSQDRLEVSVENAKLHPWLKIAVELAQQQGLHP